MKNQVIIAVILLSILLSGCGVYTSKATANICDDECQQERDDYIRQTSGFLVQAQEITVKVEDWKTVTKENLQAMIALKNQVSALSIPKDFDMAHDYYERAFNNYVNAIDYVVDANEQYNLVSDTANVQSRNVIMSQVINNVKEANKLLIYADEEIKFATRIVSKT